MWELGASRVMDELCKGRSFLLVKNNKDLDIVVNATYELLNTLLPDPKTCPPCIIIQSRNPPPPSNPVVVGH